jgi:hypothetical protein
MQEISDVTKKYYGEDIFVRVAEQTLIRDRHLSLAEPTRSQGRLSATTAGMRPN